MALSGPPQIDPRRRPARLRPFLEKNLLAYAAAASAAGIGALAFPQAAEARIVYTAANQKIPYNAALFIDLNHDGVNDFALYFWAESRWSGFRAYPTSRGNPGGGIIGYGKWTRTGREVYASALHAGDRIGGGLQFRQGNAFMAKFSQQSSYSIASGPWVNVTNRYLGLRFTVNGKFHYGWARLSVQSNNGVLTGYAYETTPNKSIAAGKKNGPGKNQPANTAIGATSYPATLGDLARGAARVK